MGVANSMTNSPLMERLSGPPLYILLFAVALEAIFWAFDIQVQSVEIWLVVLVVPLALSVAKPQEDDKSKRSAKKMVEGDGHPRKKVPQTIPGRKPVSER